MKALIGFLVLLLLNSHLSQSQNIFQNVISKDKMDKYGLALEAIFSVGLRLEAILDQSSSNFVVSPISATIIISELLLGAEGEFRDQLFDLLSLQGQPQQYTLHYYNKNKKNESCALPYAYIHLQLSSLLKELQTRKLDDHFTLEQSNALFYNKDLELRSFFKRNMIQFYRSEITPLDFSKDTSSIINNWASLHTNGLIKNVLSGPPSPTTSSIFLNSIYFHGLWETPFSDMLNTEDTFSVHESKKVVTTYMQGLIEEILYAENKDYRLICLPYKNNELGMYIVLPTLDNPLKYNLKQFIRQIDLTEILETISKAPKRDVVVKIPKLSLSNSLKLLKPLQKYAEFRKNAIKRSKNVKDGEGVVTAIDRITENNENFKNFTPATTTEIYLSGAAKNGNMLISDVIQEIVFSINEEGTEAAAVTAGITDYMGGSKTVVLNRPFAFFIRHEPTLATLFWGSISDPSQS